MIRSNKYDGKCCRCGGHVKANEGVVTFETFPGLKWKVLLSEKSLMLLEHPECKERYGGSDVHFIYNPINTK